MKANYDVSYLLFSLHIMTIYTIAPNIYTFILVYNHPSRSTQPGHPSVGRRNDYQPMGGDALQLGLGRKNRSWLVFGGS